MTLEPREINPLRSVYILKINTKAKTRDSIRWKHKKTKFIKPTFFPYSFHFYSNLMFAICLSKTEKELKVI